MSVSPALVAFAAHFAPWLSAILWASFYASVFGLAVLMLQPALRKAVPARWRFALWMLVILRFAPLPLPESRWSLFNWLPQARAVVQSAAPQAAAPAALIVPAPTTPDLEAPLPETAAPALHVAADPAPTPVAAAPTTPAPSAPRPSSSPIGMTHFLSALYLAGAAAVLARFIVASVMLQRIVRHAEPATNPHLLALLDSVRRIFRVRRPIPLLLIDGLASPALVGAFRPRLLLPRNLAATLTDEELRLVFLHETAHLRRHDIALNYGLSLMAVLHWFNPVLWLLLPRIRAERELACDELVLMHTGDPAPYGHTLLKLFESASPVRGIAPAVGIVETRSSFSRRIHMIAAFKRRPAWVAVPAMGLLALAGVLVMTSPMGRAAAPGPLPAPAGQGATVQGLRLEAGPSDNGGRTPAPGAGNAVLPTGNAWIVPVSSAVSEADAKVLAILALPLKEVVVEQQSLEAVLKLLRENMNCNMDINWKALEAAGIDRNTPVSVNLKNVAARKVLRAILDKTGGPVKLSYMVEDGVITISTAEELATSSHQVTRVYNVRDLLASNERASTASMDSLIENITSTASPDSWRSSGGNVGSITEFKGMLTITTTTEVHQQVSDILGNLRAADKLNAGTARWEPPVKASSTPSPRGSGDGLFGGAMPPVVGRPAPTPVTQPK